MGEYFDWWFKGGSWYDLQQREELASLTASHVRSTSQLSSKLREEAKRSQDLASRLSRLEDAVVAMVELEDLRGVMENFSDAAATRRYARDVLAHIPALGRVPSTQTPQVPPDVPDYWLHPAVRAVQARLHGDQATETAAADEARRRDPVRTAQFLAAVAILLGTAVAEDDLATLWPTTRQVSQYQRALWLAVAAGGLGEEARTGLVDALTWVLNQPEQAAPAEDEAMRLVQVHMSQPPSSDLEDLVMSALLGRRAPRDQPAAADALTELRSRVEGALAAGGSLRAQGQVPDGVPDLLAQVVSAGAPQEEPLVARLIEIRAALAKIGAVTSIAAPALLDEQALDVLELVRGDLAESADPDARAVAVQALREPIASLADRLAQQAVEPLAEVADVRVVGGLSVRVGPTGPAEPGWREEVAERVSVGASALSGHLGQLIAGGAFMLAGVVLGVISNPGWLVLVAPGIGMAGYGLWQIRGERADLAERTRTALDAAERAITERTQTLLGDLTAAQERRLSAPVVRQAIVEALGVPSRV